MKSTFSILLLFVYISLTCSQDRPVLFEPLTAENGLSQGHVTCMIQDSEGFIWAGTYVGLNRYNGYNFDVFYADKDKPGTLFINAVYSLFEDRDGNIWCGTWGIDIFDKKTETFRHIPALSGDNTISAGEVSAITQDKNGYMWLATKGGGLNKYVPETGRITYFMANGSKGNALQSNYINDLVVDDQTLWIATTDGGLSRMNLTDESITTLRHNINDPFSIPSDKIECLFRDKQGNLWLGDEYGNLGQIDQKKNQFTRFYYRPKTLISDKAKLMQITQDRDGNLLLITNGSGLFIYNFSTGVSKVYLHNSSDPKTILFNENSSILVDRTNTVFVGSYGRGISRYSPFTGKFNVVTIPQQTALNDVINAFTDGIEDFSGHLIVGTYEGFLVFEKETWKYKHYRPGSVYEDNKILTLKLGPDSTIWMSSMKSLHRFDKNFRKINSYVFDKSLKDHSIYSIEFDKENNLWVALFTKGLLKIPEKEWRNRQKKDLVYKLYLRDENDSNSISGNQQWVILLDQKNNLWIGGVGGLDQYNFEKDNFSHIYYPGSVKTIAFDSMGKMWLGTIGEGLFSLNFNTHEKKRYTVNYDSSHSFIYGIIIDLQDNMWITTETGLSKFNIASEKFRNYDERDGLPSNHFDDKSESMLSDGRIYMGTNNGFILFRPEDIQDDTSQVRVVLTSLNIDNENIEFYMSRKGDSIPVNQISRIDFKSDQRDIILEFAALHFAAPHKIQYQYKLEGYDKNWIYTTSYNRRARYTNLDGGEYTFLVKATNSDGKWMTDPLIIQIKVHPPFHKTLLFRFLIALTALLLIFIFVRLRILREIRQKELLSEMVDERTSEISNKNSLLEKNADDLRESNSLLEERQQFILEQSEELTAQRDELAQINATKDKLFSVIAHDLKNPFNVIIGYCDLLVERNKDWDTEKRLYFLTLLKETSESAYTLLENLLQWSRSQTGMMQFNPVAKRANEMVDMVLPDVEGFAQKKEIRIIDKTKHVKTIIQADVIMLTTILRNLITNAIKFSEKEQTITIDATPDNVGYVKFIVRDEGVGMSPEVLQSLFQVTKNRSGIGTGGEKGTGIGLLLCKDFVEHHKGKIWAESEPGKGTTFYFTIPVMDELSTAAKD